LSSLAATHLLKLPLDFARRSSRWTPQDSRRAGEGLDTVTSSSPLLDSRLSRLATDEEEAEPVDADNFLILLPNDFADPPSPTLTASSAAATSSSDFFEHFSLSSSSSIADVHSDVDSTFSSPTSSFSVDVSAALSTLSALTSSFNSRRNIFVAPYTLSF
jgi:hypothetical protein